MFSEHSPYTRNTLADSLPVIGSLPDWGLSGVNVYLSNLFRELRQQKISTELILSNPKDYRRDWELHFPGKVVRCPSTRPGQGRKRQELVRTILLSGGPSVFFPNYDFDIFGICPILPNQVITLGVIHSDEEAYYKLFVEYGPYWNQTVAVSQEIANELCRRVPALAGRVSVIGCGVEVPEAVPSKPVGPLRVSYCGRLIRHAKRVDRLADVILECHRRNLHVEFFIAGTGPDEGSFREAVAIPIERRRVHMLGSLANAEVLRHLERSHAMILTSDFEGFSVVLLEAMSRACVPVVSKVDSGVKELLVHAKNGFLIGHDNVGDFASAFEILAREPSLCRKLGMAAHETIFKGPFTAEHMARKYMALFDRCQSDVQSGAYRRPMGKRVLLPQYRLVNRFKNCVRLRTRIRGSLARLRKVGG